MAKAYKQLTIDYRTIIQLGTKVCLKPTQIA